MRVTLCNALFAICLSLLTGAAVICGEHLLATDFTGEVGDSVDANTEPALNAELYNPLVLLSRAKSLSVIDTAYVDAWTILKEDNSCSKFFGGREASLYVLNMFAAQLKTKIIPGKSNVGIRMFGTHADYHNVRLDFSFRLFGRAHVNSRGAFFNQYDNDLKRNLPRIGLFAPGTREARTLMLFHELAHLMKTKEGKWLIPDDGNNEELSSKNTSTVAAQCNSHINRLRDNSPRQMLTAHVSDLQRTLAAAGF